MKGLRETGEQKELRKGRRRKDFVKWVRIWATKGAGESKNAVHSDGGGEMRSIWGEKVKETKINSKFRFSASKHIANIKKFLKPTSFPSFLI